MIQYECFPDRPSDNDLLSKPTHVLTGKARELCDSLGQDDPDQIDLEAWTCNTAAA